jgi:predicted dehydrogenase
MPKIEQLAIVGVGSIGRRHLRLLKQLRPDLEITLVRTVNQQPLPEAEASLASHTVGSAQAALELGVQAAIICSPAPYHLSQASHFVEQGLAVLIEKPLSHSLEHTQALQDSAHKTGAIVQIGYVLRFNPALLKFRKLLGEPEFGKPLFVRIDCGSYLPNWRPNSDYRLTPSAQSRLGGGALLELSHELDYAQWCFGPIALMQALLTRSNTLEIDVEDMADLVLVNESGLPITVHLDFCRRQASRCCTVETEQGTLHWDGLENTVCWRPANGDINTWAFDQDRDLMFIDQLRHFLDCAEHHDTPRVMLQDGIDALRVVEAARQADRQKRAFLL